MTDEYGEKITLKNKRKVLLYNDIYILNKVNISQIFMTCIGIGIRIVMNNESNYYLNFNTHEEREKEFKKLIKYLSH